MSLQQRTWAHAEGALNMRNHLGRNNVSGGQVVGSRTAVGYVRVSTDMQAADGLSLDAQRAAIKSYCESVGLHLLQIHEDVESGGRADRKGLALSLIHISEPTRPY